MFRLQRRMLETVIKSPPLIRDAKLAMVFAFAMVSEMKENVIQRGMFYLTTGHFTNINRWKGPINKGSVMEILIIRRIT